MCVYVFSFKWFTIWLYDTGISSYGTYLVKKAKRLLPPFFLCILIVIVSYTFSNNSDFVINSNQLNYLFLIPQVTFAQGNGVIPLVHLW